jgi:hypothetical protein
MAWNSPNYRPAAPKQWDHDMVVVLREIVCRFSNHRHGGDLKSTPPRSGSRTNSPLRSDFAASPLELAPLGGRDVGKPTVDELHQVQHLCRDSPSTSGM